MADQQSILALRASDSRGFDAAVHGAVMGKEILSQEFMAEEARHIWKKQPLCQCFFDFDAVPGPNAAKEFSHDTAVFRQRIPRYSEDTAADYTVLCHVRERWTVEQSGKFYEAFWLILNQRWQAKRPGQAQHFATVTGDVRCDLGLIEWYEPGDYSSAALCVVMEGR